jgi:phosphopantetheinyl transferase (holo-ACP synthase)
MSPAVPVRSRRARLRVGNDVVDLGHPRCRRRPSPDRLPRRISSGPELDWLDAAETSGARGRRLWSLWAAKETAFKVVSKIRGDPPVFHHRAFEVELVERSGEEGIVRLEGLVSWSGVDVRVEGVATGTFVHLVGWGPAPPGTGRPVLELGVEGHASTVGPVGDPVAQPPEAAEGVQGRLSLRARQVARARLAGHLSLLGPTRRRASPHGIEILTSRERPGRTPPRLVVDGEPRPEVDLSLSHHGRYVGWAILLPSPCPRRDREGAAGDPERSPGDPE